ncbi:MAG TPA: Uma2 family endonuclease [Vitreimonas sp.]|uniref:Uma2 family endonuclease n=1 Tax=Vitreimonas sp. TaxID=3069702 RepID=UPI002D5E9151|nr:Uma2 family endonuclease [Vitreimonas sp.]HYD89252.1 Uma2 family endonuclease [Vitreimonas sp.]
MSDTAVLPRPIAREATRLPFTMDEVLALQAAGKVPYKRTQLLDGEIHKMPADGLRHIHYVMKIGARVFQALEPKGFVVGLQTTLHLSRYNGPSPDVYVLSAGPLVKETPSERILLVAEVADTTLADDLRDSASRYARHGVEEYWVVDVRNRRTHVHLNPRDGAYGEPKRVPFEDELRPTRIADFVLRVADLDPQTPLDDAD